MNATGNTTGEQRTHGQTGHERAGRGPLEPAPTPSRTALMQHIAVFATANTILWVVNLTVGAERLQWAYMITLGWGVILIVHVVAYLGRGRDLTHRKYTQNYRDFRWGGM